MAVISPSNTCRCEYRGYLGSKVKYTWYGAEGGRIRSEVINCIPKPIKHTKTAFIFFYVDFCLGINPGSISITFCKLHCPNLELTFWAQGTCCLGSKVSYFEGASSPTQCYLAAANFSQPTQTQLHYCHKHNSAMCHPYHSHY